jgi:hypothetical protein
MNGSCEALQVPKGTGIVQGLDADTFYLSTFYCSLQSIKHLLRPKDRPGDPRKHICSAFASFGLRTKAAVRNAFASPICHQIGGGWRSIKLSFQKSHNDG